MSSIRGADKLLKQLNELQHLKTKEAKLEMAKVLFNESQNLVPVDTGELKDSGSIEEDGDNVSVGYSADHAIFQEFGTIYQTGTPFLRPAIDNTSHKLTKVAGEEIEAEIRKVL